jgi:lipopolysaccharide biosynthesis regulator YciM
MLQLFLLLLPIAALAGWYYGYSQKREVQEKNEGNNVSPLHEDYFLGLNYLINEEPDKAVDVFIRMLEVNSDTVETHLALGNLFRKRGEVDRAIRVHQNIIARPKLAKSQRILALSELSQDYFTAGFLDRAERTLLELIENSEETLSSYNYLLKIYEQQKNWRQAIDIAKKLHAISDFKMWTPIAYYYCELAEHALAEGNRTEMYQNLKKAIHYDKNCVRANMILGKLAKDKEDFKEALHSYKKVKEQKPQFLSEVIDDIEYCYHKLNQEKEFKQYLESCLVATPQTPLILKLSEYIKKYEGQDSAIEFLTRQFNKRFSFRGLCDLLQLYSENAENDASDKLLQVEKFIANFLANKPLYRCSNCGFSGRQLYWQCPGCKKWATVMPNNDL